MKKNAIGGVWALMALLLVAPLQGRAEEPADQPRIPEAAQNSTGDGAAVNADDIIVAEPAEEPAKQQQTPEAGKNNAGDSKAAGPDEIFTVEPSQEPAKQPPLPEATQNSSGSEAATRPGEKRTGQQQQEPLKQPQTPEATQNNTDADTTIRPGEKLTVERCVRIALRNSPNILQARYNASAARSAVGQAWSNYYPQISVSGGYTASARRYTFPTNTTPPLRQDGYSWTASLTQNIIDFGRTDAVVSNYLSELDASREDLRDVTGKTVFGVKRAYYTLVQKEKNRDVLKETVAKFQNQLEEARGFYEAGVKSRFDVSSAEVNLSNWKMSLIGAENELRIARVTLNNAMGMPDAPDYDVEDILRVQQYAITFEEARDRAFLNRPDIRASAARREAAEQTLSFRRKSHLPMLSGNASYIRGGDIYPHDESSWNVGVTLEVPIFNGFQTTHQVGEAKEKLGAAKAEEEAFRQAALLNVQQAYLNLKEAEERVGIAEVTVKQAEENYDLADGRYRAGTGTLIEETDALVKLSTARTNHIAALADYKTAEADLRKAMGE